MYPENWPKCQCGAPCMDGKGTCGNVACMTHVDLPKPATREGTLNMGDFINECGKAIGFTPATRFNHYRSGEEMALERFLDQH